MPPSPKESQTDKKRNSTGSFGVKPGGKTKSRSPKKKEGKGRNSAPFNMVNILSTIKERDVMKRV